MGCIIKCNQIIMNQEKFCGSNFYREKNKSNSICFRASIVVDLVYNADKYMSFDDALKVILELASMT